jgi:hypothetical protein
MKKFLSIILALAMTLSCAVAIFSADDAALTTAAPTDAEEEASQFYDAVEFLVSYGIMHGKGDKLGVYDDIKRYEMALFEGRLLTGWVEDTAWEDGTLNSSEFTDLEGTAADNYLGAISYVNQKGVIEGYGDGRFGPENPITYQDALTMTVRALGYQGLAYPWGYIEKAVNLGLTAGITGIAFTDNLKREVVAQIIYNALFCENADGDTFGARNYGVDGSWMTVIIMRTDFLSDTVPAGYVGFAEFNPDGSIGEDIYYVPGSEFGFEGEHDDEMAYATIYKVVFDGAHVRAAKSLELAPLENRGRLEVTTKGYPIQAFLADHELVTRYTGRSNEVIIADGNVSTDYDPDLREFYAVDWATGNILHIWYGSLVPEYCLAWWNQNDPVLIPVDLDVYNTYCIPGGAGYDPDNPIGSYGNPVPQSWGGWACCDDRGNWWCDLPKSEWPTTGNMIYESGVDIVWYYHPDMDEYFQVQLDYQGDTVGIRWMTDAERAALPELVDGSIYGDPEHINYLTFIYTDASFLNAYATLRLFDIDEDEEAEYGIYDEYRFGSFVEGTMEYEGLDGKVKTGPSYVFYDYTNAALGVVSVALEVPQEFTWFRPGYEPKADADGNYIPGQYLIWGYKLATGELTVVKTIGEYEEGAESYVGHGYVRGFNAGSYNITIGDEKLSYNYPQLYGGFSEGMLTGHEAHTDRIGYDAWPAIASRFLKPLFNQYCEYVVVDERIAYIEPYGGSDDLFVVISYAGLAADGTLVVWGYDLGETGNPQVTQLRVNSFDGWINGDWAYYGDKNADKIAEAFTHGAVYEKLSYDADADAYNVRVVANDTIANNYKAVGTPITLTYQNAVVGIMHTNDAGRVQGGSVSTDYATSMRRMADTDKYTFILGGEGELATIPVLKYEGKVVNDTWFVTGYALPGSTAGNWLIYVEKPEDINGFGSKASMGVSLALFLEYGSTAAYDSLAGKNYLKGGVVYTAHVQDLITGKIQEVEAYTARLAPAYMDDLDGSAIVGVNYDQPGKLNDGYYDYPFVHFYHLAGEVYITYNGKIIDDTPVDPALVPDLIKSLTNPDGTLFQDGIFREDGIVTAKYNRAVASIDQMWNKGWAGWDAPYYQGFAPIAINNRLTHKALGEGYNSYFRLAGFGLTAGDGGGTVGKSSVFVWALTEENGRLGLHHVAVDDGGGKVLKTDSQYQNSWNLVQPARMLDLYDDNGNASQSYWYTMLVHENSSNMGKSGNDLSYAIVYTYDFEDDEILRSSNFDPRTAPFSFDYDVNGVWLEDLLEEAAEADAQAAAAQAALDEAAEANPTPTNITNYISNDRIIAYVPFDGNTDAQILNAPATKVTLKGEEAYDLGVYHKALNLAAGHIYLSGVKTISGGFTAAAWVKMDHISSDPVLFGTKDWDSGKNKGFLLCVNSDSELKFNIGDGDGRDDHGFSYTNNNDWIYVVFTVDPSNHKVGLSVNFGDLDWYTYDDKFDDDFFSSGKVIRFGNDNTDNYDRIPGYMDDALLFTGVATASDIANLKTYYGK